MPSGLALLPPAAAAIAIAAAARFLTRLARNLHTSAAAAGGASEGGSDASAPRDGLPKKYSNLNELEADAQQLLTAQAYGYYAGGSENEWTLRENVAALARYRLLPRVLVDVSAVDTSTTLLGVCAGCAGCTGGRRIVGAGGHAGAAPPTPRSMPGPTTSCPPSQARSWRRRSSLRPWRSSGCAIRTASWPWRARQPPLGCPTASPQWPPARSRKWPTPWRRRTPAAAAAMRGAQTYGSRCARGGARLGRIYALALPCPAVCCVQLCNSVALVPRPRLLHTPPHRCMC